MFLLLFVFGCILILCFLTQPHLYSGSNEPEASSAPEHEVPQSEPESLVAGSTVEVEVDPEALPMDPLLAESLAVGEVLEPEPQVVDGSEPEGYFSPESSKVVPEPVVEEEVLEEVLAAGQGSAAPLSEAIPEEELADIEEQIIPDDAIQGDLSQVSPPVEEVDIPSPPEDRVEPVPVDEVIPDPIHIEPLQEPSELPKEIIEETQPPVYEKADITSELDNELREQLDAAEKLIHKVS